MHPQAALDAAIAGDPSDHQVQDVAVEVARARLGAGPMPDLERLAAIQAPSVSLAAALMARDALARLDAPLQARAATLAAARANDERSRLESDIALAWSHHLAGARVFEMARDLEAQSLRARLPQAVLDAATLTASAALVEQELTVATSHARRASRMARTEGFPHEEYLAHLVLARVRRHHGRPHLAARIVSAIARVAPPAWSSALGLELFAAGAFAASKRVGASAVGGLDLQPLYRWHQSAQVAGQDSWREACSEATASLAGLAPLAEEFAAWCSAIDPWRAVPPSVQGFLGGSANAVPGVLAGLSTDGASFRVIVWPDHAVRRVLAPGGNVYRVPDLVEVGRDAGAKQLRRETALLELAFAAAQGLEKEELFRRVWGFQYAPHLHQGVLDVLLHRVRAALGDAGDLVRVGGRVELSVKRPISVVDVRVEPAPEDTVLRALAERGQAKARELSQALTMPLRTVQQALGTLVADEECTRVGEGQNVTYRVEDTTFREPTRVG